MSESEAIRHYSTARGYVQSAYAMMSSIERRSCENDFSFFLSFHMLIAFSLELYLKSFIIFHDDRAKRLASMEARHNLEALQDMAAEFGFDKLMLAPIIGIFSDKHKSFEFRYMKPESSYKTTNIASIFFFVSLIDLAVDKVVGASVSRGKQPGGAWIFPIDRGEWRLPGATNGPPTKWQLPVNFCP